MISPGNMAAGTTIKILPKRYYVPLSFKHFLIFVQESKYQLIKS